MATLQELETALVNADRAGDIQAATALAHEIQKQRSIKTADAPAKPERLPKRLDSLDLTWAEKNVAPLLARVLGENPQGSVTGRVVQGAADAPVGAMQLAANLLPNSTGIPQKVNERVRDLEGDYKSQRKMAGSEGFDLARLGGNVGFGVVAAPAAGPGSFMAQALRGTAMGAGYGAAQPVTSDDFWKEKAKQIIIGGITGAATAPLARMVQPETGAAARKLMDEGITLTPGQILGGGFKRTEDALTSVPIVGDAIRNAKNRTLEDFNRAAYARALRPVGQDAAKLPVGPEGVAAVKTGLSQAYDDLLPKLTWRADGPFVHGINNLRQLASDLPEREAKAFESILTKNLQQISQGGSMDGQTFKLVEGSLAREAKSFLGAPDPYQKKVGEALIEATGLFRQALQRSNPSFADELAKANQGYANYARIRGAAASAGDKSHGFTPAQLAAAIRSQDKSAGKDATASGEALMQDLSNAAREVLPSSVADSGTPLRHLVSMGLPGAAAGALAPATAPYVAGTLGAAGLSTLPYTPTGQKLAQMLLAQRPAGAATLADLLRQGGPILGAAAGPALLE